MLQSIQRWYLRGQLAAFVDNFEFFLVEANRTELVKHLEEIFSLNHQSFDRASLGLDDLLERKIFKLFNKFLLWYLSKNNCKHLENILSLVLIKDRLRNFFSCWFLSFLFILRFLEKDINNQIRTFLRQLLAWFRHLTEKEVNYKFIIFRLKCIRFHRYEIKIAYQNNVLVFHFWSHSKVKEQIAQQNCIFCAQIFMLRDLSNLFCDSLFEGILKLLFIYDVFHEEINDQLWILWFQRLWINVRKEKIAYQNNVLVFHFWSHSRVKEQIAQQNCIFCTQIFMLRDLSNLFCDSLFEGILKLLLIGDVSHEKIIYQVELIGFKNRRVWHKQVKDHFWILLFHRLWISVLKKEITHQLCIFRTDSLLFSIINKNIRTCEKEQITNKFYVMIWYDMLRGFH